MSEPGSDRGAAVAQPLEGRHGLVIAVETAAGAAIARAVGLAGADLGLASMRVDEGVLAARRVQRELREAGRTAAVYAMDITLGQNVIVTTRQVTKELGGRLDFVVSAVDARVLGSLRSMSEAELDRLMRPNFFAHAYAARAAAGEFRRSAGGQLLFVVHALGEDGRAGAAAYSAAHAATLSLVRSLAGEFAEDGAGVCALVVGDADDPAAEPDGEALGGLAVSVLSRTPAEINGRVFRLDGGVAAS